ncbi:hypothetical protein [Gordonia soli]|uniref:Uncharacterized protein n=1 Tax=Gordonia soli NBRC 108243 TaxID=1223545 RepID=M0QPB8_9ACTN|nr:hypothetical protein [Gordonia soli]GAC69287.1 hypothetical protein GS4_23_00840 [Gordonia soli NBRC 108243]
MTTSGAAGEHSARSLRSRRGDDSARSLRSRRRATAGALVGLGLFQAGLAAGRPWGRFAYGGTHDRAVPVGLRRVSAIAAVGYAGVAGALVADDLEPHVHRRLLTGVAAFTGVGTVLNAASPSVPERATWTPVCLATTLLALWARARIHPAERPGSGPSYPRVPMTSGHT